MPVKQTIVIAAICRVCKASDETDGIATGQMKQKEQRIHGFLYAEDFAAEVS
jgi:hypothetical protein